MLAVALSTQLQLQSTKKAKSFRLSKHTVYKLAAASCQWNNGLFHTSSTVKPRHVWIVAARGPNCRRFASIQQQVYRAQTPVTECDYKCAIDTVSWYCSSHVGTGSRMYIHAWHTLFLQDATPTGNHSAPVITGYSAPFPQRITPGIEQCIPASRPVGMAPSSVQGRGPQSQYKPHSTLLLLLVKPLQRLSLVPLIVTQCMDPAGRATPVTERFTPATW